MTDLLASKIQILDLQALRAVHLSCKVKVYFARQNKIIHSQIRKRKTTKKSDAKDLADLLNIRNVYLLTTAPLNSQSSADVREEPIQNYCSIHLRRKVWCIPDKRWIFLPIEKINKPRHLAAVGESENNLARRSKIFI